MLKLTRACLSRGGLKSDSSVTCPDSCPLTLQSSGWRQLFCLELWSVMVKHRLKIKIGRIVTYLYTKFKMNALGIIKWNNSIGECHSNERPVDFQVDRNQQKALFKQVHLVKRKSYHHSANVIIHLLTFDLLTIKWGRGKAECEQCLILKAMFVITKLKWRWPWTPLWPSCFHLLRIVSKYVCLHLGRTQPWERRRVSIIPFLDCFSILLLFESLTEFEAMRGPRAWTVSAWSLCYLPVATFYFYFYFII